ncbi:hypothetical protein [Kitasatospora sp. NPDC085879]|uniref:hypothetical protein n=1 Tax=Kitasatospora sp. NPDC085879 TaxID=3154769 RepID=UPI00343DC9B0
MHRLLAVAGTRFDAARPAVAGSKAGGGALPDGGGHDTGGVTASPAGGAAEAGRQLRRARRPVPSRRLRRLHPRPPERQELWHPAGTGEQAGEGGGPDGGTPLGILIGGSAAPATEQWSQQRVDARLMRIGRGTCLLVLPSWRAAIAVAVPTERLLASTGLTVEELAGARLSVLINPEALHDRDLGLHGWQAEPPH